MQPVEGKLTLWKLAPTKKLLSLLEAAILYYYIGSGNWSKLIEFRSIRSLGYQCDEGGLRLNSKELLHPDHDSQFKFRPEAFIKFSGGAI